MKPTFAEFEAQDRRLVILRALEHAAKYRTNAFLLRSYLEHVGHTVSADRMEADLAWLHEQGLVELEKHERVSVATLTERGLDVATGRASVPGVQRPRPGH